MMEKSAPSNVKYSNRIDDGQENQRNLAYL